jgi:hypothetical protein
MYNFSVQGTKKQAHNLVLEILFVQETPLSYYRNLIGMTKLV